LVTGVFKDRVSINVPPTARHGVAREVSEGSAQQLYMEQEREHTSDVWIELYRDILRFQFVNLVINWPLCDFSAC
jgi:hypothetical protein